MNLRLLPLAVALSLIGLVPAVPVRAHEGHHHGDSHDAPHHHEHGPGHGPHHEGMHEGDDHHHDARHGGIVRTAGAHHLELVPTLRTFSLWIQDGDQHDLPVTGARGKLIVKPAGQAPKAVDFRVAGDHLEADVNLAAGGHLPAIVQVVFQGKRLSARFPVDL